MSEKPIVESIENLCENLSVSDLPTLKDYFCELKAEFDRDSDNYDYFFADLLHDTYSYNKRIDSGFASHVDYQIAVLKAALEADWPLFDPSLDIGIEIATQSACRIGSLCGSLNANIQGFYYRFCGRNTADSQ